MQINEYRLVQNKYNHPSLDLLSVYSCRINNLRSYDNIFRFFKLCLKMDKLSEEYLYVISYDAILNPLGVYQISHGSSTHAEMYEKNLFEFLLLTGADQFVLIHNHVNGTLEISNNDIKTTIDILALASKLKIEFIEHMIISKNGYKLIRETENY